MDLPASALIRRLVVAAGLLVSGAGLAADVTIAFLSTQPRATRPTPGALERELVSRKRITNGELHFEYRFAEGAVDRLPEMARELIEKEPALLFCADFYAARAAAAASSKIPIVFVAHVDPVEHRFLATLRSSNRNITGVTTYRPVSVKIAEVALDAFPKARRMIALLDLDQLAGQQAADGMKSLASQRGSQLVIHNVAKGGLEGFLKSLSRAKTDVVLVTTNAATWQNRVRLIAALEKERVPAVYESDVYVAAGGLLSYGPSYADVLPRVTEYVERVAAGESPADLPILQPTKTELVVNLGAARRQGIALPIAVMQRADRVIE